MYSQYLCGQYVVLKDYLVALKKAVLGERRDRDQLHSCMCLMEETPNINYSAHHL